MDGSTTIVSGEGPQNARLAIVGEAPGNDEYYHSKRPFTGPAGDQLTDILTRAGLKRHEVYITNVIKDSPQQNPSDYKIAEALPFLVRELTNLPQLNVVVAMGGTALKALSGFKYSSITKLRGSILETLYGGKFIPTLHPAYYMRGEWRMKPIVITDMRRAVGEAQSPYIHRPDRRYIIEPTFEQAVEGLNQLRFVGKIAFDIETFGDHIACIGFAPSIDEAICIPIMRAHRVPYWSLEQETHIWKLINEVLRSPALKIAQNGMFDINKLADVGVEVTNFWFDTMLAHHLLLPELPHGLDFIASVYSTEPYYKDEGKTWGHDVSDRVLWTYNLKDCTTTFEAALSLEEDLREEGMWDYFQSFVMQLPAPLIDMQRQGILVDRSKLSTIRDRLESEIASQQAELNNLLGRTINVKSPKDCQWLLDKLGIRLTKFTPTGRPKLDEETLRMYYARVPDPSLDLVFSIREKRTLVSGFLNLQTDPAGYYHPGYLIHGTKSGRLSSRSDGQGPQIQNVPDEARGIFVSRPGYEFINLDLKQAEAMIVAWLAEDELMMEFFRRGLDIHRFYASLILQKPEDQVSKKPERHAAKRIEHGSNYKMGPRKMVSVMRNEGIGVLNGKPVTEAQTKEWQAIYFSTFPGIVKWHTEVEETVRRNRCLYNCFGRKRVFLGIFDDDLVREAVSFIPQSTVGELTNRAIETISERLRGDKDRRVVTFVANTIPTTERMVLQVHDSLMMESPFGKRDETISLLKEAFNIPLNIKDRELTIPIELSAGPSWGELTEL